MVELLVSCIETEIFFIISIFCKNNKRKVELYIYLEFINQIDLKGKYYIIYLLLLWSLLGFAQTPPIIAINDAADAESFYGPEQLIEDVLIDSPCSTVSDFSYQVSGSPANNTTKSYGYFRRAGGTTFPFESGIVISSGIVFEGGIQ